MGTVKIKVGKKCTVRISGGKKYTVKIVPSANQRSAISSQDVMMDERATEAVKSAIAKAEFCKKPIAKYDTVKKQAYIEYADGARKYVE